MADDWLALDGAVCVVTGGTGGIGRSIVSTLADAGARVAILDLDETATAELASQTGRQAIGVACDISDEASVLAARHAVARAFGRCDVLVNNAAILTPHPLLDAPLAQWSRNVSVNLTGYYLCSRVFGSQMMETGGGAIVHLGSIAVELPQPNGLDYSACKAAIQALSRQIAVEWGDRGIRSNVVNPGPVVTPMTARLNADPDVLARRAAMTAIKRLGTPQDIANIVAFLCSPRSAYVTGADLMATGGLHVMMMKHMPQPAWKPTPDSAAAP